MFDTFERIILLQEDRILPMSWQLLISRAEDKQTIQLTSRLKGLHK